MNGAATRVEAVLAAVRAEYAPDSRVAVFEVEARVEGAALELVGAVSEPAAAEALHRRIALLDGWAEVRDAVVRLPEPGEHALRHVVVSAASAPMLAAPMVATPMVSQVVLGHHLLVLRRVGRWFHCRSDDGYLGWVHRGYLVQLSEADAREWEIGTAGEACLSLGAELRSPAGDLMLLLPRGARVVRQPDGGVRLPDGRVGRITGELIAGAEWPLRFPPSGDALVASAPGWLGAPYLWGGVTPAGVDCSGFVQALLRMHGVEIPRDSDQQARVGAPVEPGPRFAGLRAGDLCFFAEEPGQVTHVAISEGGSRIIHSSLGNGGVARNDLAGELEYERELVRLFVCARRMLP